MSVEEARERILDYVTYDDAAAGNAIDRLILEVQAEIACEYAILADGDEWTDRCPCPSCTARMKLKETADEPLPGARAD